MVGEPGKQSAATGHFCMVGDFQQSIYGRRADLKQYLQIHQALLESGGAEELEFSVTFRLDQKQVDCVNKILSPSSITIKTGLVHETGSATRSVAGSNLRLDLHADDVGENAKMRESRRGSDPAGELVARD